jgi:hypothetical protein
VSEQDKEAREAEARAAASPEARCREALAALLRSFGVTPVPGEGEAQGDLCRAE